jgi:hypothetical protein
VDVLWRSNSCLKHTFTPKACQAPIICHSSSPHRHTNAHGTATALDELHAV